MSLTVKPKKQTNTGKCIFSLSGFRDSASTEKRLTEGQNMRHGDRKSLRFLPLPLTLHCELRTHKVLKSVLDKCEVCHK